MSEFRFSFWTYFAYIIFPFTILGITYLDFLLGKPKKEGEDK